MLTSLAIPEELLDQLERGNVVPRLGVRLAQDRDGEQGWTSLSNLVPELARRSRELDDPFPLFRVVKHFVLS
jgi:hypothetical protein